MTSPHAFGGDWTEQKLEILKQYLSAYTTALKNKPFKTAYIDAFAGTGTRRTRPKNAPKQMVSSEDQISFIQDKDEIKLASEPIQQFLDGSARIALQSSPPFDRYIFIEKSAKRAQELKVLETDFAQFAERITIQREDANVAIQKLCKPDWSARPAVPGRGAIRARRAVLFLDPYGMQVEWKTIKMIAGTKAIDLWVLFPIGAVVRMRTRTGRVSASWKDRLNSLFGTHDWYERFYRTEINNTIFGPEEQTVPEKTEVIGAYFLERLRTCFAGVAANPAVLRNSKNSQLYLLCFAVGNPAGAAPALKIASSILKKMGSW